ncbi:MAG: cytochrome-c peroxidase, partial [Methylococcaceae bacterium]|nr:cytochrome-c peroxidase [Methylococcaceae bacterium]
PDGFAFVDKGSGAFVGEASENGKFKVPTLRNVAVTGPYMHNGYFKTLRGVVAFYSSRDIKPVCKNRFTTDTQALKSGCWPSPEVSQNENHAELGALGLTSQEINDIVAFLRTLTDGYRPERPTLPK